MPHYPEIHETYDYLTKELNKLDIAYIHLVDHSAMEHLLSLGNQETDSS
jgi:N-ethylmaleimide reductase